ncbi:MAG: hypothetical protein JNJ87_08655 [Acinetobacter junii]|nr:hypothetical protein [Acinetobacter junii]
MKAKIIIFLIPMSLIACSSPASTEDIKKALNECPDVALDIKVKTSDFGFSGGSVVTKRNLKSYLKDCLKEVEKAKDPNSKQNIINRQRALVD